ncbi:MAG: EpsG family protein [Romboutsia sp.]|uniref:EpsG family protein n=1 Tax=Romboutsia sp. TaxID=1965302 RepID=UPI002172C6C6|nr:EpsG family protein [Romboutsia sp.]MCI9259588.1 EpsG family protein [Romboutsia sp.]
MYIDATVYSYISYTMFLGTILILLSVLINNYGYNNIIIKIYRIAICLLLCIFYAKYVIRSHDSINYYIPFYEKNIWRTFEPGYTIINNIGQFIGFNSTKFIFLVCFISVAIFLNYIIKILDDEKNSILLIYILFTSLSFNFIYIGLLRQGISLSIAMIGIYLYIKNKKQKALIFLILSASIHYSSFIFLGIFIVEKLDKKVIKWIIIVAILIGASGVIYYFIDKVLLRIFTTGNIRESLVRVYKYAQFNEKHETYIIKYIIALVSYTLIAINILNKKEYMFMDKYLNILSTLIICVSITYFAKETSARILNVFNILSIVCWVKLYSICNLKNKNIILNLLLLLLFLYSIVTHKWIVNFISRII